MAASALFILDLKGRVILSRDYRGDVPPKSVESFISRVNELEETGTATGMLLGIFPWHLSCPWLPSLHFWCPETRGLAGKLTPVIYHDGISYTYVQYSNLYLLIASRANINAAAFLGFLHKLKEVFVHYFNELEEESLRDNFVIAYELLDEVCLLPVDHQILFGRACSSHGETCGGDLHKHFLVESVSC